jgi:type I restriction enzyme S subunit
MSVSLDTKLPEGWAYAAFEDCVLHEPFPKKRHIPERNYLESGTYPVVDQGAKLISGYTNDPNTLYEFNRPVIIFGDHTKVIKYVDFPFAIGADGTKILVPNEEKAHPKFFCYALRHAKLPDDGYNRHFKYLKKIQVPLPTNEDDQIAIANELEQQLAEVERMRQAAMKQKEAVAALQGAMLREVFPYKEGDELPEGWRWGKLGSLFEINLQQIDESHPEFWLLPFLGLENIESHTRRFVQSEADVREAQSASFRFDTNHVLYGKLRPYLDKVYLPDKEGRCSLEILPLKPKEGYSREFIALIMQSPLVLDCAIKHSTGGRMPRANIKRLLDLDVPLSEDAYHCNSLATEVGQKLASILVSLSAVSKQTEAIDTMPAAILKGVFDFDLK